MKTAVKGEEKQSSAALLRSERMSWLTVGAAAAGLLACYLFQYAFYLPLGGVLLWVLLRKGNRQRRRTWFALGAAGILVWIGLFCLIWYVPAATLWNHPRHYTGTVLDYPRENQWGWSVEVRLKPEGKPGVRALMDTRQNCAGVRPGDRIELDTELRSPGERDPYRFHANAARGIFARTKTVESFRVTHVEKMPLRFWPRAAGRAVRDKIKALFSGNQEGLMLAMLTGDQQELTDPLANQLSRTGLRHIAAVSGLHMGILMGLVLLLPGDRRVRQLAAGLALVLYSLMTGGGPSVVRAAVMNLALLLGPFLRRDGDSWSSLRVALLVLVIHNPFALESISLQLSFGAVCGILLFGSRLNYFLMNGKKQQKNERISLRIRRVICANLAVTLSAMVFTMPLVAWHFDTIAVIGPLANVLLLWAVEGVFLGSLLVTALSFFSMPLAQTLVIPLRAGMRFLLGGVQTLSSLPFCAVSAHVPVYFLWLCGVYAVLILLWKQKKLRKWSLLAVPALGLLLVLFIGLNRFLLVGGGMATQVVDVGQGQSVLFLSGTEAAAVDCGGEDAGNALANAMGDAGEFHLELLALTHFDSDHVDGLEQLLRRIAVETIAVPDQDDDSGNRARVERLARKYGANIQVIRDEKQISLGTMQMMLFPPVSEGEDNDAGLSVLAQEEDFSVLLTGDMGMDAELALAKRERLQPVDVLVAGHHGSKSSSGSAFLHCVKPETAVISCGAFNRYGHPAEETLLRLKRAGCTIRRTDLEGTVTFTAPRGDK